MSHEKFQYLSKVQVAKQQIDEAIWMFFNERNPIAIHTVVGATHQLLHDITDRQKSMIKNDRAASRSTAGNEWFTRLNKEFNFLKHGKGDKDAMLTFDASLHEYYLVDCVYMYRALTGETHHAHSVFDAWCELKHPTWIGDSDAKSYATKIAANSLDPSNKEYFAKWIERES